MYTYHTLGGWLLGEQEIFAGLRARDYHLNPWS